MSKFTYFVTDGADGDKERQPSPVYRNAAGGAKVIVTDVADGCAASGMVVKGDTLLSINGTRVTDEVQGRDLAKAAVGVVVFSIQRGGGRVTVTAYKLEAATRLGVTIKDHLSEEVEAVAEAQAEAAVEAAVEAEAEAAMIQNAGVATGVSAEKLAAAALIQNAAACDTSQAEKDAAAAMIQNAAANTGASEEAAEAAAEVGEAVGASEEARLSAAAAKVEAEAAEEAARLDAAAALIQSAAATTVGPNSSDLDADVAKARLSATMRSGRWWRQRS